MSFISLLRSLVLVLLLTVVAAVGSAAGVSLETVDMGQVVVDGSYDSTITDYIPNTGGTPLRIDSVRIVGIDASSFILLFPAGRTTLAVGESLSIRIRFIPRRAGAHRATIEAFTSGVVSRGTLQGEGSLPPLVAIQDTIDFGSVRIGDFRDSLVALARNITSSDIDIPVVVQDGADVGRFTVTGGNPSVLAAGALLDADIRFAPTRLGRAVSRIVLNYIGPGSPVEIILIGNGVDARGAATLVAPELKASIGEIVEIPIRVRDARNLEIARITGFHVDLRMNASMLIPVAPTPVGYLDGNERVVPLDLELGTGMSDSILVTLRFRAVLGNDSITALRLTDPVPAGGPASLLVVPGSFRLTGYCHTRGPRLVHVGGRTVLKEAMPNPAIESLRLEFELIEEGRARLSIKDLSGAHLTTLLDEPMRPGVHSITASVETLPAGTYLCVLETPTESRSIVLRVGR